MLDRPRVQFLYVHHVFKDEEAKMDRLMAHLARQHTFIPYGEGVDRVLRNEIDKPYICISSDDGFKNNLALAAILERHGAKGCFFINPSIIGEDSSAVIEAHCREKLHFPPVEFLDWKDVERLQKAGHEIGSHTMAHTNVAAMTTAEFTEDCGRMRQVLMQRCGEAKHFAFPYGRFFHFNEAARKVVFDGGFISCATAERGATSTACVPWNRANWSSAGIMSSPIGNWRTSCTSWSKRHGGHPSKEISTSGGGDP